MDDLLDFINSQHHSDDLLDQVLCCRLMKHTLQVNLLQDKLMLISHIFLHKLTKLCINLLLIGEQMVALQDQM